MITSVFGGQILVLALTVLCLSSSHKHLFYKYDEMEIQSSWSEAKPWLQVLILCKIKQTCCQIISSGSDCHWWQTKKETQATDHWVASRFYSLSSNPNFWSLQLHQAESIGQWLVLAGERLSAALFPDSSLLNQFAAATLPLRGNKSS